MDAEALAIFDALDGEMTRRQRAAVGTDQSAVLARVWENTAKVALIKAVSANPADPVIRAVDAKWAREVVEHCIATLLVQAERHLAENEMERNQSASSSTFARLAPRGSGRTFSPARSSTSSRSCGRMHPGLVESEQIELLSERSARGPATSIGSPSPRRTSVKGQRSSNDAGQGQAIERREKRLPSIRQDIRLRRCPRNRTEVSRA